MGEHDRDDFLENNEYQTMYNYKYSYSNSNFARLLRKLLLRLVCWYAGSYGDHYHRRSTNFQPALSV